MQDKHKVTLYIPQDLHRQLKIKAAVDAEPMSAIAERALDFYLDHADVVDAIESSPHGDTHRVYACPECATSVVLRSGEMVSVQSQSASDTTLVESELSLSSQPAEAIEELVPASV